MNFRLFAVIISFITSTSVLAYDGQESFRCITEQAPGMYIQFTWANDYLGNKHVKSMFTYTELPTGEHINEVVYGGNADSIQFSADGSVEVTAWNLGNDETTEIYMQLQKADVSINWPVKVGIVRLTEGSATTLEANVTCVYLGINP